MPAAVRHRWKTNTVVAEDHGDELILRPAPDDPVDALFGIFKDEISRKDISLQEVRQQMREEEAEIEARKAKQYGW